MTLSYFLFRYIFKPFRPIRNVLERILHPTIVTYPSLPTWHFFLGTPFAFFHLKPFLDLTLL